MPMGNESEMFSYFVMPEGDVTVRAYFDKILPPPPPTYNVTVTATKGGSPGHLFGDWWSVTYPPATANPSTDVEEGTMVDLRASPATGYVFSEWVIKSGAVTDLSDATSESTFFTMPAGDVSVEAVFSPISDAELFPVTVTQATTGGGEAFASLSPSASTGSTAINAREGDVVYFSASAESGYAFAGWEARKDGELLNIHGWTDTSWGVGGVKYNYKSNPLAIAMPRANIEMSATFVPAGAVPFLGHWSLPYTSSSMDYIRITGNEFDFRKFTYVERHILRDVVWEPIPGTEEYPTGYKISGTLEWGFPGLNATDLDTDKSFVCVYLAADGRSIKMWDTWNFPEEIGPNGIESISK
jgi:hypothetical protein